MTAVRRRTTTALVAVVVGVLAALPLLLAAPPAQASTYRYWTYWWSASNTGRTGGWVFSSVGPAGHKVGDTWVLGWRFSTTTSTTGGARPRQSSDFATLCPSLADPVPGKDRVALVLDYGTLSDAPPGQQPPTTTTARVECLTLTSHPTGLAVLNAAQVAIRSKDGLVCALDGYPQGECAPLVADPSPTATAKPAPTPSRSPSPARTSAAPAASVSTSSARTAGAATSATPPSASASSAPAAAPSTTSSPEPSPVDPSGPTDEPTLAAASGAPSGGTASRAGPGSPVATVVGTAVVVALAGAAFWISRRRS